MFEMENVDLDLRQDALQAIAKKAIERKTGARGLRSIIESTLLDTMYKVPSESGVVKVVVDKTVVDGESSPKLVYEKTDAESIGESERQSG